MAHVPLPSQPADVAWPTDEWPVGEAAEVDRARLDALVEHAIVGDEILGHSDAFLVVQGGRIVVERYHDGCDRDARLLSWSMAKSVTHAAVGVLVREGRLVLDAPAPVPEWSGDARGAITLEQLLRMRDGLDFEEVYERDDADAVRMLFGDGKDDVAAYAVGRPLAHAPGTHFNYSSGTSNVVARIVCDCVGRGPDGVGAWLASELFAPIGATSFELGYDGTGTFVGSTFAYATARDFARFGTLYLRSGVWDGREVVGPAWVDHARTPATDGVEPGETYRHGAHWWLWDDGLGTFAAHGFGGQRIAVVPALDLVLVRIGATPTTNYFALRQLLNEIVACFVPAPAD